MSEKKQQDRIQWEGEFQDFDEPSAYLLVRALDPAFAGRCVVCGAEQPNDVRWPSYALEVEKRSTGETSSDIEYRACPKHERTVDLMIGAPR